MPQPASESTANAVSVPLSEYMRSIAVEAARVALAEHAAACPVAKLETRVRRLEVKFAALLGFMAGSGFLGGLAGGFVANALS